MLTGWGFATQAGNPDLFVEHAQPWGLRAQVGAKSLKFDDLIGQVASVYSRIMRNGAWNADARDRAVVVGLTHDTPTVRELVDCITAEAEAIIGHRLARFAAQS
jgi:hypothetical protein